MALSGFFSRLKEGLSRSTQKLSSSITAVFTKRKLDDAALDELEELLIGADLGPSVAGRVIAAFRRSRFGTDVTDEEIKTALADEITTILEPVAKPLVIDASHAPFRACDRAVTSRGSARIAGSDVASSRMASSASREWTGLASRAYSASTAWAMALRPELTDTPAGSPRVSSTS